MTISSSASVRIMIVEDQGVAADMAAQTLTAAMPCEVTVLPDPLEAIERLSNAQTAGEPYHATVVDMLFQEYSNEFETRRRRGQVRLDDDRLHVSGLAVLHAVTTRGLSVKPVLWTGGEANRRLHMVFAYEILGCRALCSKDAVADLPKAVAAALAGDAYIHPVLSMYLPPRFAKSIGDTVLASRAKLAVWRAMALGQHQHKAIANLANVTANTVKKGMEDMRTRLLEFDPGCLADGSPTTELIRYASQNWEFFLDDTVRKMYR